ncbi:unnamed protein product, partial [marine sediment metagenome]
IILLFIKKELGDIDQGTFDGYIHQSIPGAYRSPGL